MAVKLNEQENKPTVAPTVAPAIVRAKISVKPLEQLDPLPVETWDFDANPDIRHGAQLYSQQAGCLVHRFAESDFQKDQEERDHNGGLTNFEMYVVTQCEIQESNEGSSWLFEDDEDDDYDYSAYFADPPDCTFEDIENGHESVGMCKMNTSSMGASLTEPEMEAARQDFGDDVTAEAEAGAEFDGPTSEADGGTSPDAEVAADAPATTTAAADDDELEQDDDAPEQEASNTATVPKHVTKSGIKSKVDLGDQFTNAASPPEEAPEDLAVAAQPVSPQVTAANNQSYQMRA